MTFTVALDKQWLTAAEAAAEQLADFAFSERQVQRLLRAGEINSRKRAASGGGREFHWTDLPRAAREEYLKRYGVAEVDAPLADPKARVVEKDLRADARQAIVTACAAFVDARKSTKGKALRSFCAAYERGAIKLPDWVLRTEPKVAVHQLRCWERVIRNNDGEMPTDRRGRPAGSTLFDRDPALKGYVVAAIAARPHLSAHHVLQMIEADTQNGNLTPIKIPPLRTLQAFLAKQRRDYAPALKALSNPDKFRSHHQVAYGSRSAEIVRINQRWEIDGTRADVMCRMPDGSQRRPSIIALVDVFTRRMMALVVPEGSAAATKALLRRAILAWGVPEILKADNGKDFIARDVTRFCRDTGIQLKVSRAFHPEQKPHIERTIGSLNRGLLPMLPGFVGHNVADRKAIEARDTYAHRFGEEARLAIEGTLTPEALQARIDAWLHDVYEHDLHTGIDATPAARAAAFADQVRRIPDERALDALLMPPADGAGLRNVLKKGIRVGNRWYICAEMAAHAGHRVHVRMDPHDLSRIVVYDREGGAFLFVAEDASLMDSDRRMKVAAEAHAVQRKHLRLIRNDVRTVQRAHPPQEIADRILRVAGGDGFALSPEASQAMEAAQAPRLVEHARALAAMDEHSQGPQPIEPTPQQCAEAEQAFAELRPRASSQRIVQCDGYERPHFETELAFYRWAEAWLAGGKTLDEADTADFSELKRSHTFALLLASTAVKETA